MPENNQNKFQHFLITAFNIDLGLKSREAIIEPKYLLKRFQMFQDICYPSVVSQTNQNFLWLCFFDSESPDIIKEKINKLTNWKNFIPVYVKPIINYSNVFSEALEQYVSKDTKFAITSNLDNDDAIATNFIQTVQNNYREQEFEFINLPFGYMLREDGLFMREFLSCPFLSLIERAEDIVTCKIIEHHHLFKLSQQGLPVHQAIAHPTWLQLIHDSNAINYLDVNAVIQNPNKLKYNFIIEDFARQYLTLSYRDSLNKFLKEFILKNKYNLPRFRRIRNSLSLVSSWIPLVYSCMSLRLKSIFKKNRQLSVAEAKLLCKKHSHKALGNR
jgi:hypothetical protein